MKEEIFITGRNYKASATYDDGRIVVHVGSQLNYPKTTDFKPNEKAYAARKDETLVRDGIVIKECVFDSPSTAAQFITGGSRNGYDTWKVKKGYSLGAFLQEQGVRSRRINKREK